MKLSGHPYSMLMAGLLVGCSGKTPPPEVAPPPPVAAPVGIVRKEPPVVGPEVLRERRKDEPRLGLKIRLSPPKKLYRGWPLLVDVGVAHPEGGRAAREGRSQGPLKLIPASGGWDSLVKVRFAGPAQAEVVLPLVQMFHPQGALVLEAQGPAPTLRWYLGPEGTRALTPGAYAAFAELDASFGAPQGGWMGQVASMAVFFEVRDAPAPLPPSLLEGKALAFAQYEVYRGQPRAALATLEAHLAEQPESPAALSFKAQLLESEGELEKAYAAYSEALRATYRQHPGAQREAPLDLLERRRALRERLRQGSPP